MFSGESYNYGLSIEMNKAWIGSIGQLNANVRPVLLLMLILQIVMDLAHLKIIR
jgi:hypothetical protein